MKTSHNDYADRKNKRQAVSYDHVALETVLSGTYGLMVYQEDIMRVATTLAGYTLPEADDLRKACAKKIRVMIRAQRAKFVDGVEREGYGRELGDAIFDKIEPFADYAFPKSHAYGYALIGYQNAWLKANYPVEYMSALLTSFRDDKDKAAVYLSEARQMGITVGVPDVNQSFADYTPSLSAPDTIAFGMAAVRNVGEAVVDKIVAEREAGGSFDRSTTSCAGWIPVVLNRRTMESLIKAGAFDSLGVARQGFLLRVDEIVDVTLARRKDLALGISTLFAAFDAEGQGGLGGHRVTRVGHRVRTVDQTRLRARDARHLRLGSSALWRDGRPVAPRPRAQSWPFESEPRSSLAAPIGRHGGRNPRRGADSPDQGQQALRARHPRRPRRIAGNQFLGRRL